MSTAISSKTQLIISEIQFLCPDRKQEEFHRLITGGGEILIFVMFSLALSANLFKDIKL